MKETQKGEEETLGTENVLDTDKGTARDSG